ncbi:molybdate ABC transporter permease subunit [Peribacillus tepidiphilus]|uniref:molybdate ABC transporter permease subunit n=1 Tax=Peribacillus tepidiphilus TaxID=2652445 RepID=UPI0035B51409
MMNEFWSPVILSVKIACISSVLVLVLGILAAKRMRNDKGKKIFLEILFLLPLVLPPSVVGFLLIIIFGHNSPVGKVFTWIFNQPIMFTIGAAVIASTVVAFPLMYQSAKAGFQSIDKEIEDAGRVDGGTEGKVFFYITLPLSLRFIMTGFILSFARAMGEFGATLMFAGNIPGKTQTIPTAVYIAFESGNTRTAWLWAAMMIAISFIMLLIIQVLKDKE